MSTPNKLITNLKILTIALALSVGMSYAFADWSNPPAGTTPPANNTAAPINVGSVLQTKTGPLLVYGLGSIGDVSATSNLVEFNSPQVYSYSGTGASGRGGALRLTPSSSGIEDYYFQLENNARSATGGKFFFTGRYALNNTVTFDIKNQKVGIKNTNPTVELDVTGKTKTS